MVEIPKAQGVHHGNWPCAHRNNVANNATNTGSSALEGFDEAGVVVTFNLEGHRPPFTNIDYTRVFSHAHHQVFGHGVVHFFTELTQVNLGGLVGAVLAPHHRVHRQFTRGGPAA